MNRLLLILFLYTVVVDLKAQAPALYFERVNIQNGLSHNKVNCILQDKRGFMWIGTNDGLNRFDGYRFTIYRNDPENKTTISGNIITSLLQDEDGILWITTADGGLSRFDYRLPPDQQFIQYKHLPGDTNSIPANALNAIMEDRQKRLWLATSNSSVVIFDKRTKKFISPIPIGPRGVLSLAMDGYGKIWAGRQGGSILRINPHTLRYEWDRRYDNLYAKLPHAEISSLYRDKNNHIWFGSWDRQLYRFDAFSQQEETFRSNNGTGSFTPDEILSMAEDNKGLLWMGGHFNGLQVYDPDAKKFYHYQFDASKEGTVADNRINCIYRDKDGLMWLGTNKGISVSNPLQQQFMQQFLPAVSDKALSIHAIYEDINHDLFFGTSNGLFIKRKGSGELVHQPIRYKGQSLAVSFFFRDGEELYIGTNYSLFRYDKTTNAIRPLPNTDKDSVMNQIIESRVVSVIKDSIEGRPVLLVSPYGHFITYYDLVLKKWVSRLDSTKKILANFNLKDNLVHKFYKAGDGQIWLANAILGLGEWTNRQWPKLVYHSNDPLQKNGLSNNHVYDIINDRKGNLWISTYGGGLHYMDTRTRAITHIPNSPNLLEGLQIDSHDNVWMVNNGEITRYDPVKKSFIGINLPDIEKTGGVSGYFFKDSNGKFYIAGLNYFISFHPDSITMEKHDPEIRFTDFQVFGTSYSHFLQKDKIVLPYYKNTVAITFSAPDYNFSSPPRFAYKLEGNKSDWTEGDPSVIPTYSNLEGGDYVFMVKLLGSGNDPARIARLPITIIPPYWKRWWFYALSTITLSLIILVIYRYRINELLRRQAIRNKIAQDLHDNMGSALSSISIYSRVAQIQHSRNEQNQLEDVLKKITTTSTDVISEMNDIVWAINPRNDSMEKVIQRMESYARPLTAAENIVFNFSYDREIMAANLSMEKRKNIYLIFKEALNNAIKYAGAKTINARIRVLKKYIRMQVEDDGKGFDMESALKKGESSTGGNGLNNMMIRAREMKGVCRIESVPGGGTKVTLDFLF